MSAPCQGKPGQVLREAAFLAGIGLALALFANAVSPRGLSLTRDYFPGTQSRGKPGNPPQPGTTNSATPSTPAAQMRNRLQSHGLALADSNQVIGLFRDPRYQLDLVVFVDARNDQHYAEGHIPGARQFDHYRPERYLEAVVPACEAAEQIVVYCNGGDCEDSEFTALALSEAGIPKTKLLIYGGGFAEWTANGLPVELGLRNSGNLKPAP